jgi:hypothetical protein
MTSLYVELRSKEGAKHVDASEVRRVLAEHAPERGWMLVTEPHIAPAAEALPPQYTAPRWKPRRVVSVYSRFEWAFSETAWAQDVRAHLGIDPFDTSITEPRAAHELSRLLRGMIAVAKHTSTHWRFNYCGQWAGVVAPEAVDEVVSSWIAICDEGSMTRVPSSWAPGPNDHVDDPWPDSSIYPACLQEIDHESLPWKIVLLDAGPNRRNALGKLRACGIQGPAAEAALAALPVVVRRGLQSKWLAESEADKWAAIGAKVRIARDLPD